MAEESADESIACGVLRDGTRFMVPDTMSVLDALVTPKSWRSPSTLLWIAMGLSVCATGVLYFCGVLPLWFFVVQFVFWRLAYNIGIGYMLGTQSVDRRFEQFYKWCIAKPGVKSFMEKSIVFEDSTEYRVEKFPDEFNAWMLFRQIENIILANDLVSYMVLSVVCWKPMTITSPVDIACFLVGAFSVAFALWSKSDAHRVIGDFAWYWGDFFFLLDKNLTFDGIFQMFPHPMYTVGYAFMYGVPIMAKSYTLFYVGVFGHMCQLLFLAFVENPHIERTYNNAGSITNEEEEEARKAIREKGYLGDNELVVFLHFDIFRASDLLLALSCLYLTSMLFFPIPPWAFAVHYVVWRLFHNGFLGYLLSRQARENWFSQHYSSPQRAFNNWKRIYNASVTVTNLAYLLCALKLSTWDMPVLGGGNIRYFAIVLGLLLVGVHVYVSLSVYETLGDFGYFYGDFFITDIPPKLNYSGVYRYLNDPDSTLGMAAFYGIALISGSWEMLLLAIFSHVCVRLFDIMVEKPFMKQRYGTEVRAHGGMATEIQRRLKVSKAEYDRGVDKLKGTLEAIKDKEKRSKSKVA